MRIRYPGLLMLMLALVACGQSPDSESATKDHPVGVPPHHTLPANQVDSRWLEHLSTYPGGEVGARAPLIVRFTHPVVDDNQVGTVDKGVARLDPQRPFKAVFTAPDRLEIRPARPFPAGEPLTLTLYPQALSGIDDSLPPLVTRVTVMHQALNVRVDALAPAGDGRMVLEGRLETRDQALPDQVAKVVMARQGERSLDIVWRHTTTGLGHDFTVRGIQRAAHAPPVSLHWNGKPLGVDEQGGHDYPVPAPEAFQITTVRAVGYPQPHVQVQFSLPLLGNQNLAGLVTLDGKAADTRIDGSRLLIYPKGKVQDGKVALVLNPGLRSDTRVRLEQSLQRTLTLTVVRPGVRFVGEGSILPNGETLSVPFEAVGAHAVKVQAFEVYQNNIPRYLQNHALDSGDTDTQNGRWLWQKTLSLPPGMGKGWRRYRLDLTELMAKHPHGLVMLTLKLDADTIDYRCAGSRPGRRAQLPDNYEGPGQEDDEDSLRRYYRDSGYLRWSERDDPCSDAYYAYNDRAGASRAFLASNLGLIAKRGENDTLLVFASQLDHNTPAANVGVDVYNYQHQRIGHATTNGQGEAAVTLGGTPFYLVARQGDQKGYLKLARNLALPTNQFDTGGEQVRDGLKGFFYGERDVWRPGDDIHLTFVLGDPDQRLPDDHPITVDWFNPRGDKVASYTNSKPVGSFYAFTLKTDASAPTGNWRAVARIGERYFETRLRVEAIKPNHLKIDLEAPDPLRAGTANPVTLHSQWLNGATAGKLKTDVKVRLINLPATFSGYDGFDFQDPTRVLKAEPFTAFEGQLNAKGDAEFQLTVPDIEPPGMAAAVLTSRVFENSGDYSTQIRALSVAPYRHWVGLHVPKGTGWGDALSRGKDNEIGLLTLNSDGKPEAGRHLTLSVYRIDWRWWWDRGDDDLTNFISDPDTRRLRKAALVTDKNGRAQWTLHGPDYDWGRHLIRVCQDDGRHCASKTVYLGWSGERGAGGDAATRLALSVDKEHYRVGDTARVKVPAGGGGRLLVSLENGVRVLKHYWVTVPAKHDSLTLDVPVTADMAPNVYVDVTLLQPHAGRDNDRPIRLYGIASLLVDDPDTRLQPVIDTPHKVRPEQRLPITVSEHSGRPMTYTLAVVDEGLLGLTNFHTPSPHDAFYKREALGVRTWDLFDQVVGAYGGDLDQLLALGGSDALQNGREKQRRRFPPVVRFLGPFQLAKGEQRKHNIKLPAYMGQVRVMVVAGDGRAYGHADRDVTVTQPLTLLATLPRVLGPGERLDLPVTVFAAEDDQGNSPAEVTLSAEAQAPIKVTRGETRLHFKQAGDQIGELGLATGKGTGIADVTVRARSGDHRAEETVHMPVRAPNPPTTEQQGRLLEKDENWEVSVRPHGIAGTNQSWLIVSRLPDMGLQRRLEYLIHYPHGCVEQTVSSVLPQLYLGRLIALDDAREQQIQTNVNAGISRLRRFQLADGGFSYWPGSGRPSDWGTSYAGHFLLEAKRLGYAVPAGMLDSWRGYQKRLARDPGDHPWQWSGQAYRLYTLALAGAPEVGAMNRLREVLVAEAKHQAPHPAAGYLAGRWLLAAAYQRMGLVDVAGELMPKGERVTTRYRYPGPTYGSQLRDRAIALQVRDARGDREGAWRLANHLAAGLASQRWYSTQSLSWALMAMARFAGGDQDGSGFQFRWRAGNGDWRPIRSEAPLFRQDLALGDGAKTLAVRNDSDGRLFVSVTTRGTPAPGNEKAVSNGLTIHAAFVDRDGKPLDPASLSQGTDFQAIVTVHNDSGLPLDNLALTQVMPSGWQIAGSAGAGKGQDAPLDYRDVRDDRVMTYFSLANGATRRYTVSLNASFAGHFYLPGWQVEAMYDGSLHGRTGGQWVEVYHD